MSNKRNLFREQSLVHQEVASANVDTDGSGYFSVQFDDLRSIESKALTHAQAEGGYVVVCSGVNGNTATFGVFQSQTSNGALSAVNASNVTNVNAFAWGKE